MAVSRAMTILYRVHNNLYVNLTNRCNCACTFCLRQTRDHMDSSGSLWLEHEPSVMEVKAAFADYDLSKFQEIVFCGFGEPTMRLDDMLTLMDFIRANYENPIRVNTNGLANLLYKKDVTPLFQGRADTISISLNTPNPERYNELTRSCYGLAAFDGMLEFAGNIRKYVPNVVLSTVDTTLTKEEEEQCRRICKRLGVTYRIREWEN